MGGNETEGIRTVENFILTHAVRVPVTTEADYDETVLFRHLHSRLVRDIEGRTGVVGIQWLGRHASL